MNFLALLIAQRSAETSKIRSSLRKWGLSPEVSEEKNKKKIKL